MIFKVTLILFLVFLGIWLLWGIPYLNVLAAITGFVAAVASALDR